MKLLVMFFLATFGCDKSAEPEGGEATSTEQTKPTSTATGVETASDPSTATEIGETGDEVKADPPKAIVDADGKVLGLFDAKKLTVTVKNDKDEGIELKLVSLEEGFDKTAFATCTFQAADCTGQCILPLGKPGMKSASEIYIPGKLEKSFKGGDSTGSAFQSMLLAQLAPGGTCETYVTGSLAIKSGDEFPAPQLTTYKLPFRYAD